MTRQNALAGLVRGRYNVEGIDAKGRVMLRDESGKLIKFDPAAIDPSDKRDALRLSEKHKETIYEGDKTSAREAGEFRPTIPDHLRAPGDRQASASRIDPASLRATPQLDVHERNIERSRQEEDRDTDGPCQSGQAVRQAAEE